MKTAYNELWLNNLNILKSAKQFMKSNLISKEQYSSITAQHESKFYHPNFIIRILLFIATAVVVGSLTGLLILVVSDASENVLSFLSICYGIASWSILDKIYIKSMNHFKSGITEAILYHSITFIVLGASNTFQNNPAPYAILFFFLFAFASYRYLDLISTVGALSSLAFLVFYMFYQAGGVVQQIIPIVFIGLFTPAYFFFKKLEKRKGTEIWEYCLIVAQGVSLLFIYAAGNYLVVRELSLELMNLDLQEGQDIPFAILFYSLTILIPFLYLYFGIKNKDVVLLRVSLAALAFSVFTFKYYYSLGHHEVTLTVSGLFLLCVSVLLMRWMKTPKFGYTRENILNEDWANSNAQAFIIAQTFGPSKVSEPPTFGGGESGGGGAASKF